MVERNDDQHVYGCDQDDHMKSSSSFSFTAKKHQGANKEKLKVAISSIAASVGLAIFKIVVGLSTNSLYIIRSFPFRTRHNGCSNDPIRYTHGNEVFRFEIYIWIC